MWLYFLFVFLTSDICHLTSVFALEQTTNTTITASVGENRVTIFGYTSPNSKVELTNPQVYSQTYSDNSVISFSTKFFSLKLLFPIFALLLLIIIPEQPLPFVFLHLRPPVFTPTLVRFFFLPLLLWKIVIFPPTVLFSLPVRPSPILRSTSVFTKLTIPPKPFPYFPNFMLILYRQSPPPPTNMVTSVLIFPLPMPAIIDFMPPPNSTTIILPKVTLLSMSYPHSSISFYNNMNI